MTAGAFVDAGKLQPGDEVTGPAGEPQTLAATRRSEHPDGIAVYNFRAAGYHTYYAAAPGGRPVLVHNADCTDPYPDPRNPDWNNGATHVDHRRARSLDGTDDPGNLWDLAAETNVRKGGLEGRLVEDREYLRQYLTPQQVEQVLGPEIESLGNSPPPIPLSPELLNQLPYRP